MRPDRKRDANKRTSLLPHVKNKTRSTTSKILSLPRILGKNSFKKKGEFKKIKVTPKAKEIRKQQTVL